MKRTLILTLAVCALLASAIYAFADIAKPKPSPAEGKTILYTGLTVTSDPKAYEARLQISQETLKHLQNAAANNGGDGSMVQRVMHSSTRTIMAGTFMFLAVSFAGIWFARSGQRRNHKAIAAVFMVAVVFGIATVIVRANAGPPGYIRWQNLPQSLKDGKETVGGVQIELVPGDDNMKLIIPLRKTNKPGEE
jgi:heme/copper-type cytochrome/quinol oxidase subunit 3